FLPPPPAPRSRRRELLIALAAILAVLATGGLSWLGYVARLRSLPPEHERLLKEGLSQYNRGEYRQAAATFSRSLTLKPGWPDAHFAHGQAQRQLGDWTGAETSYAALEYVQPGWAHALAGYCRLNLTNR